MSVTVVVGGVQATFKAKPFICDCVKFELMPVPPSYLLMPLEYRKRLPFILLVQVDIVISAPPGLIWVSPGLEDLKVTHGSLLW